MTAYYNEFDPAAAAWLRELIAGGHIAPGDVDERDIRDIRPDDLRDYDQCHFFAGIGGWSLALRMAGWPDDQPVWTGSCPCQPFSAAGKRSGVDDERHLWPAFFHLIAECAPPVVLGEQVASKDGLGWLDLVCADLEGAGYAVGSADMCVAGIGGPHIRQRLWFGAERLADAGGERIRGGFGEGTGPSSTAQRAAREWQWGGPDIGRGFADGGLADADDTGSQGRGQPGRGRAAERAAGPGGVAGRVEHAQSDGTTAGWLESDGESERGGATGWPGPLHGFWRNADWLLCRDGKWRPVEARPQPLADGLPEGMGHLLHPRPVQTEEGIDFYADLTQARPDEIVRKLCLALAEEEERERPIGGVEGLLSPSLLLAFVCQLATQGWSLAKSLPLSRPETAARSVRMLWDREAAASSPCERGLDGQLAGEFADIVHLLSPFLARDAQTAWGESLLADAEVGFPLGKGSPARVARLRGYGNAISPPVAAEFIQAWEEARAERVRLSAVSTLESIFD